MLSTYDIHTRNTNPPNFPLGFALSETFLRSPMKNPVSYKQELTVYNII